MPSTRSSTGSEQGLIPPFPPVSAANPNVHSPVAKEDGYSNGHNKMSSKPGRRRGKKQAIDFNSNASEYSNPSECIDTTGEINNQREKKTVTWLDDSPSEPLKPTRRRRGPRGRKNGAKTEETGDSEKIAELKLQLLDLLSENRQLRESSTKEDKEKQSSPQTFCKVRTS